MAITFGSNTSGTGANTFSTGSVDTSGANLIVIGLTENTAGGAAISDNKSNTWNGLTEQSAVNPACIIYYAKNATVGSGHTFTATGSSIFAVLGVAWFAGADTTAPFDQQNGTGGGGFSGSAQPGSITPTTDGQLVVTAFAWSSSKDITSVTGYTQLNENDFTGGTNYGGGMAYAIQGTASATNPSWNFSGSVGGDVVVASFKAGAGGGGSTFGPIIAGGPIGHGIVRGGRLVSAPMYQSFKLLGFAPMRRVA